MTAELDISVLIATHNRADTLRETLEALVRVRRDGLSVEYVVIDNNSQDHTKDVVDSFADRLPVRYLYQPRPGKNCALNHALDTVTLGEIVVFTDDDVTPMEDWLAAILATSARWLDISVFGGRIDVVWPDGKVPAWAATPWMLGFAFGAHDPPGGERPYQAKSHPFGGNFWVRRAVLDGGRRFDEGVGPRPKNRIMGSETTFLQGLGTEGYVQVYGPDAIVGHRIEREMLRAGAIRRRAYRQGRGVAHWRGPPFATLLRKSRLLWYLVCWADLVKLSCLCVWSMISGSSVTRLERTTRIISHIGHRMESLGQTGRTTTRHSVERGEGTSDHG